MSSVKYQIETEYGITAKPNTSRNTNSIVILEHIHQVLGNLVQTCNITQHRFDPWLAILFAAAFTISSTKNRLKCYSPGQFVFGRDMILLIKHTVDWELICYLKENKINKDGIL